jgi:hypothetical protein
MQPGQQPDTESSDAPRRGRGYGRPWPKGASANPSGLTRKQVRLAEFTVQFQELHGRSPGVVEAANLRACAAIAARLDRQGLSAEDLVRLANTQARLIASLGLDAKPAGQSGFNLPPLTGGL